MRITKIAKLCINRMRFSLLIDRSLFIKTWVLIEPRCEKTYLQGLRPDPTQTRLYNHTRWL